MKQERPVILITGASGFTGIHACSHFTNKGMNVVAVVRRFDRIHSLQLENCRWIVCDLTDREQVLGLLTKVRPDYVLHLAGRNEVKASWQDPVSYVETNMMATLYVLEALQQSKDQSSKVLIAGSMLNVPLSELTRPPHPYSFSKTFQVIAAQSWGSLFKQHIMIAQPSNIIGPGPSNGICGLLARKAVEVERGNDGAPFVLSSEGEERDYVDVRDVVAAYETILFKGEIGTVYSIGTGKRISLGEVAKTVQSLANKPIPLTVSNKPAQAEVAAVNLAPIHALGWRSRIPFHQSIQDTLNYFRNEMNG